MQQKKKQEAEAARAPQGLAARTLAGFEPLNLGGLRITVAAGLPASRGGARTRCRVRRASTCTR